MHLTTDLIERAGELWILAPIAGLLALGLVLSLRSGPVGVRGEGGTLAIGRTRVDHALRTLVHACLWVVALTVFGQLAGAPWPW